MDEQKLVLALSKEYWKSVMRGKESIAVPLTFIEHLLDFLDPKSTRVVRTSMPVDDLPEDQIALYIKEHEVAFNPEPQPTVD